MLFDSRQKWALITEVALYVMILALLIEIGDIIVNEIFQRPVSLCHYGDRALLLKFLIIISPYYSAKL